MKKHFLALGLAIFSSVAFANEAKIPEQQELASLDIKPIHVSAPQLASIALKMPKKALVAQCVPVSALAFDQKDKPYAVVSDTEVKLNTDEDIFFADSRCQKSTKSVIIAKDTDNSPFYFSSKKAGETIIHMSILGVGNLENKITVKALAAKEITFTSVPSQEKTGLAISEPIVVSSVDEFGNVAEMKEKVSLSFYKDSDCATPLDGKVKGEVVKELKDGKAAFSGLVFDVDGYVFTKAEVKGLNAVCSGYMSLDK